MSLDSIRGRRKLLNHRRRAGWIEDLERRVLLTATFASPVSTQIITNIFPVVATAVGDVNNDGIPDLVVDASNLTAQVFFGTAIGAFTLGNIYPTDGNVIALGSFTSSGNLDLATAAGVLPGDGAGDFGAAIPGFTLPANTVNLYAVDVTGSGVDDLIASTFTPGTGAAPNINPSIGVSVLLCNGDGTFQAPISETIASAPNLTASEATFAFDDFNNDGIADLLSPFGVSLGSANGTFAPPIPLPFSNPGPTTPAIPTSPLFAVGDFTGNGDLDVATLPAVSDPGYLEVFLGNGTGHFTDNGTVLVGTGDTITSLTASDLSDTGYADLVAGVITPATNYDIAVLNNSGAATFSTASLYGIGGPSVGLTIQNFNGNPDILTIDQPLGGSGGGTILDAVSADVLLNSTAALPAPALGLRSSSNPVVAGADVTFTATVLPPSNSTSGVAAPTGNVTFFDGTTSFGTSTLVNGVAKMTTTESVIGLHQITYEYSGDTNWASATSSVLSQTVLVTSAKVPLLLPAIGTVTFPSEFLPGDKGTVSVTLTNGGGALGHGKVDVDIYLSADGAIDSSAIALDIPALQNHLVSVSSGHFVTLTGHFIAGTYTPADYFLIAQVMPAVAPVVSLTASEVSSSPAVSAATYQAAGMVFGDLGTHHGKKLTIPDAAGHNATFSISGPGLGTITQSGGQTDLVVTGTTLASHLTIASSASFTLNDIQVSGALGALIGKLAVLAGNMDITGGVKQLTLGSVNSGSSAAIAIVLGAVPVTASLGSVANVMLTSAAQISGLTAASWQAGSIDAPSISKLVIAGAIGANVRTHGGGALQAATIGSVTGGLWAVAGGIGSLRILGDLTDASIYAGADTGPSDIAGTSGNLFIPATITSVDIGGTATSSLIVAGATAFVTGTDTTRLMLLARSRIAGVTVVGAVSADSRFLAAHLPAVASLDGTKVPTAGNPNFEV